MTVRTMRTHAAAERGVALITTMLIMMLMSALMIGLTTSVMSDQRSRYTDRDRAKAFYAANSGLEKLTAELADLFFVNVAPSEQQVAALSSELPVVPGVSFVTTGPEAYGVQPLSGGATPPYGIISTGPYQGLIALKKEYELKSSVHTTDGGEAYLRRKIETVAIPVFQFGMFSDPDLSFHAGPNFNFGGRIHTNSNLFLAEGNGATLTLEEKVTAVKEVVRKRLVNGVAVSVSPHEGTVRMATAPGAYRNLALTEGSVTDGPGSTANNSWPTLSLSTYNGYIRTGKTGARVLNLPLITSGGSNTDMVRRPAQNEDVNNPTLFNERFFTKVSLRVLLSDFANDITGLPGVTPTAPVQLDGNWTTLAPNNGAAAYTAVTAANPQSLPIARLPLAAAAATVAAAAAIPAAGATANITVSSIPDFLRHGGVNSGGAMGGVLRVTDGAGTNYDVTCTGNTANTFTGCLPQHPLALVGAATIKLRDGMASVNGAVTGPAPVAVTNWPANNSTITVGVAADFKTFPFAQHTFWVENAAGTSTLALVSCTGYDTTPRLTGCSWSGNALANTNRIVTGASADAGTGVIGGFIKIERQNSDNTWTDVTMEILNYGIGARNLAGKDCGDPTPNAILRIQRLRDNNIIDSGPNPTPSTCGYAGSQRAEDYWPQTLFDTREGIQRDGDAAVAGAVRLGGVMHYIAVDVANLSQWFAGTGAFAGGTGPQSLSTNGYSLYFSDRRNNRTAANAESGEYGFEDVVNPSTAGVPDGVLDAGEDVNANGQLDSYGQFPSYNGVSNTAPPGALAPLTNAARPVSHVMRSRAQVNRAILFRRALKLINGSLGSIVAPGFTVASENPVYIQGNYNANAAGFGNPHVATSVIADSVTLLSNNWNDTTYSFVNPYTVGNRPRSADSWYRVAIIGGKNAPFPKPAAEDTQDFGTDGGAHNFLRMLEAGGGTVHYRGSLATFYFSRQATGVYKVGPVYGAPTRDFRFDTDFLDPALLPPLTPVFRDLNSLGFTQEIRNTETQ
jgi:hypothetical protein